MGTEIINKNPKGNLKLNADLATTLSDYRKDNIRLRFNFALELGIDIDAVAKIENNKRKLNIGELLVYCSRLAIDPVKLCAKIMGDKDITLQSLKIPDNCEEQIGLDPLFIQRDFIATSRIITQRLGKQLRIHRDNANRSMRSVGDEIGIVHTYVSKVEHGQKLALSELVLLSGVYKLDPCNVISTFVSQLNDSIVSN